LKGDFYVQQIRNHEASLEIPQERKQPSHVKAAQRQGSSVRVVAGKSMA
jgi:hypothetical protein